MHLLTKIIKNNSVDFDFIKNMDYLTNNLPKKIDLGNTNFAGSNGVFNANSPLDQFYVADLLSLKTRILGNLDITITNVTLYANLILLVLFAIHYYGNNDSKLIPNK